MSQNRVSGFRPKRVGAALAAVAMVTVGVPAVADADSVTDAIGGAVGGAVGESVGESSTPENAASAEGSVTDLVGAIPEEIVIGGPALGSEGLEAAGSGEIAGAALSIGQTLGSVGPLEAIGSAGGSAAASVASSGSLPGSTYVNPSGSLGSGTIGLGSVRISEYVIPLIALQLATVVVAELGARQDAGQLTQDELNFWHGVVEGSAAGGAAIEDAAAGADVPLPGQLTGSIDAVQIAAEQDPHVENERKRVEAEAAAAAAQETGNAAG